MKGYWIIGCVLVVVLSACHRTAPQSPSRRSGSADKADSTVLSLMEMNQRMAERADADIFAMVDSLHKADGSEFVQLPCGAWKKRRDEAERLAALYADTPKMNEKWRVHFRTYTLDGNMLQDVEGDYTIKHYEMPLVLEEAVEDMYEGETAVVYAPWYTAFGVHGTDIVKPYTNVRFEVTLKSKEL